MHKSREKKKSQTHRRNAEKISEAQIPTQKLECTMMKLFSKPDTRRKGFKKNTKTSTLRDRKGHVSPALHNYTEIREQVPQKQQ